MKKILIFSLNYYPNYIGGAEVAIKEIVERLNKEKENRIEKYEFHMITLRFDSNLSKQEIIHGIKVHRIGWTKKNASIKDLKNTYLKYNKYYYQLFAVFYAIKLHLKYKYNFIWAIMAHSCGSPAGIFKFLFPKVKYVLTLQEGDPTDYIEKLAKPFPKFLFFLNYISYGAFKNGFVRADVVQSISTFLNNWAIKMGNKNKKVVIPNGVDVKNFTKEISNNEIKELKQTLGKKEDESWLITTSRLVHKNGIDDVIKAVKFLPERYHFLILGIGPDEEKYKTLTKDLNVENRVHFLGQVDNYKLPAYLKACDVFIRPSRSEGMGNSFIEAMSIKIPVISTTEGGLSDFIFDEKTAFVCEKDNPESIIKAIEKIEKFKQENKLNQVIDCAYNIVIEKYDWNNIANNMKIEVFN